MKGCVFIFGFLSFVVAASAFPRLRGGLHLGINDVLDISITEESQSAAVRIGEYGKTTSVETLQQIPTQRPDPARGIPDSFKEIEVSLNIDLLRLIFGSGNGVDGAATSTATPVPYATGTSVHTTQPRPQPTGRTSLHARNPQTERVGICYSPYNTDSSCKSQDQVNSDINRLGEYSMIRSYGIDCDQVQKILRATEKTKKKIYMGIYNVEKLDEELKILINSAKSSWSRIKAVYIGNELVNSKQMAAGQVVNAVRTARSRLRQAGYSGPVGTVDTVNAIHENPELCRVSDHCAVNVHAFFDPNTSAADAGKFVKGQVSLVAAKFNGSKKVVVTETGWPSQGQPNGRAVPSEENQRVAVDSIKRAFSTHGNNDGDLVFLLSAFNDGWKTDNPSTFGVEKYWGIVD
ncbi:hypothetical protein AJ80_01699 [Polytolypa hystricis UAMH7299]|uniref:Uncharacterized protein n=1 Tax=Polytolypa hystricis (strain UAMH7299) TaxID=1447883 RepID=A0A2B7YZI7_POLH7|nr:hypothetical protein AJ80_01699 [Polytolypa hystricis UAMH7299]